MFSTMFSERIPYDVKGYEKALKSLESHLKKLPKTKDSVSLLLGHWYEIMALYYVKSILTEISASRQDRRVLQKSKIIRIEFLSKWGMLQTSRYV